MDRPTAAAVLPLLGDCPIGRPYVFVATVDSTNLLLRRLAAGGAPQGTVVVADEQTAGRGRRGRRWFSAPGCGIWMSVLLRPRLDPSRWGLLTLMTAVAVREAVAKTTGVDARVKWPNDLLVDGRKVCGILLEAGDADEGSAATGRHGTGGLAGVAGPCPAWVVAGIGLNVRPPAEGFPPEPAAVAATLEEAAGRPVSRPALAAALCRALARWYGRLEAGDGAVVLDAWRSGASWMLGRRVRVLTGTPPGDDGPGPLEGTAVDVAPDGGLIIATGAGHKTIYAGDVSLRVSGADPADGRKGGSVS